MTIVLALVVLAGLPLLSGFAQPVPRDRWSADELEVLASLRLSQLSAAPADESNRVETRPEAARLGRRFFHEARFSRDQTVSCASCHAPDSQFQDGRPVSRGVGEGRRRAMPVMAVAHSPWKFWDGRKDSLWSQALGPLEDAAEHGSNRVRVARLVREHYRRDYEAVFGALPDMSAWPADASPQGSPAERAAWAAMPADARMAASRVFANLGKAIAAYERTVGYGESRFDRYVQATLARDAAGQQVLTPAEVNGLRAFIGPGQCVTCHNGPLLSDQHFHNTGVPQRDRARPDLGRAAGVAAVVRDEFNCLGPFSDADKLRGCQELRFMVGDDDPTLKGAFKTPSLRNVALRAPYMHAGQIATLSDVVAHYATSPAASVGHSELAHAGEPHAERVPIRLSEAQRRDVVAFLHSLSGPVVDGTPP
ncbi:MAG: cytochrome-c peroxidase [Rhizobacter sp.]|nr:cytochrome-c peroxidase [Rhizobacter sp.]